MKKRLSSYYAGHNIGLSKKNINRGRIINCIRGENPVNEPFFPKELIKNVDFFRYPDPLCQNLRKKLAQDTGYPPDNILCTNGSDEALILLMQLLTVPGEEIILCPPTFFNYEPFAKFARAKIISIVRKSDFSLNMDKLLSSITKNTKLIVLDSPGNPCGALIARRDIKRLLKTGVDVLVDEAYFEYCQETVIDLVRIHPNLIITRSFSKWAGLAGLRVGYVVAREEVINGLVRIKVPCNVNGVAQYFASYALDHKDEFIERLRKIIDLRERTVERLRKFPEIKVISSHTAFFIIKLNTIGNCQQLQKYLEGKNILVMAIDQARLENSLRVNVGTEEALERFCSSFEKWMSLQKAKSVENRKL